MTKQESILKRQQKLMPNGIPRWIRCYDNQGTGERYTVVYTKKRDVGQSHYVGMSANPFHLQGIGQHGSSQIPIDVNRWGFSIGLGRKNHLGIRIPFSALPPDCQKLVIRDYVEFWLIVV